MLVRAARLSLTAVTTDTATRRLPATLVSRAMPTSAVDTSQPANLIEMAGFEIIVTGYHGTEGKYVRPFIVARNT